MTLTATNPGGGSKLKLHLASALCAAVPVPESELVIVPDAGHSEVWSRISRAWVATTDRYANLRQP